MADQAQALMFYANLLRDEIKSADAKVSAAIASSSIILSANFLMLRSESLSTVSAMIIVLASGCALLAMIFSILAILPKEDSGSDTLYYFKHTQRNSYKLLLEQVGSPTEVVNGLAQLCHSLSGIVSRKYARVRLSLRFLMISAVATSVAVLLRFLGRETFGLVSL